MKIYCLTTVLILLCINIFAQDIENYTYKLTQSTSEFEIWTTTPANKTLKTTAIPQETGGDIKVYCAKNEFEPLVFIVKPTSNSNITINIEDFGAGIQTQLNQVKYVNLSQATDNLGATGAYPDPLLPVQFGESISIQANENTAFWITVYVPENTAGASDYTTSLSINNLSIPVKLHVFNFSISEIPHLKSQMNFSHNSILTKYGVSGTGSEYWSYVDNIKQFFIDHRLTPKSALWSGGLTSGGEPYINYDCSGNWTDNDGIWGFELPAQRYLIGSGNLNGTFTSLFNNGAGFPSFMCATFKNNDPSQDQRPETFCNTSRNGTWSGASSSYNTKWFEYITSMQNYLNSNNLLDKAYYYFANEPQDQADYDAIAWYSQELKKAAPNLKLMISEEPKPEIYNHSTYTGAKVDIWLPVLHHYDPSESWSRESNHNEESWIYFLHGTRPPYFNPITLDHQGVESKFTGWFLWKYRLKGIAYYACNDWSKNPWTNPMTYEQNGNTYLMYPPSENNTNISYGSNNHRFVPSIRLELIRDGFEDYEYLYTYAGGQPEVNVTNSADTQVDKIISGLTSYTRDAEFMYNLRRLIGLKNGGEIASVPDINPETGHWRSQGAAGKYYINFQDPSGLPTTTSTDTKEGLEYKYYSHENTNYLQVGTNNYDENLGYGWYAPNDVNWMMRYDEWFEGTNDLQKSYIYSDWGRKATFEFDLPNGTYEVTASVGKRGTYNNHTLLIEGIEFFNQASTNNECITSTKNVTIADKRLTMEMGDGSEYTILNYLKIEGDGATFTKQLNREDLKFKISPNPLSDNSTVSYMIPKSGQVNITIFDVNGKEIKVLENKVKNTGTHQVKINNYHQLSKGIYFCKMQYDGNVIIEKIIK